MRRSKRLSGSQVFLWTTLGVGSGLVAGFALSEWIGGVNQTRVRRVAKSLGHSSPSHHTSAASARAVEGALAAEKRLAGCSLTVLPVSRRSVELRGWVGDRGARTLAARVAGAVPGVESVINSILVRGEDDRIIPGGKRITDQSA
ncbi:MAG TPA: BON domain-containing protein [Gemmatimonadales bacterium]|nr:BON domain-containing protein [Gemmatimonadales bacterium]